MDCRRPFTLLALLFLLLLGPAAARSAQPVILVLGDSLSAAYGLPRNEGWVHLLQQRLRQRGFPHQVVNASVTGETSAGGAARLPALLERHRPQLVLIELGGNDGLRGLPVEGLRRNLGRMVELARARGAEPLLFAMRIPPNYGLRYTEAFESSFAEVAAAHDVELVPFFLGTFALQDDYFQDDATHPNARAQPLMLEGMWPTLEKVLKQRGGGEAK